MKILFLESHPMWIHGLPNGFCDAGHNVMISGPLTELHLIDMISIFRPELIITMGWTPEHTPQKQHWIRKYSREFAIPLIYWATEDPTFTLTFSLPLIQNVQPDFVFTICAERVPFYQKHHIRAAHMDFGYHTNVHSPTKIVDKYRSKISIVANAYPQVLEEHTDHYRHVSLQTLIVPLLQENIRIDFYGRDWDKMSHLLGVDIPQDWIHGYLSYTEANKVYSSSAIIIGLQNYRTQVTQRTYEILGSGGLLLTDNTPAIRRMFCPGKDLSVSSSPAETLRLTEYFLKDPEARQLISNNGRRAVSDDTYLHRAHFMLQKLQDEGILTHIRSEKSGGELVHYTDYIKNKYEYHIVMPGDTLWEISRKHGLTVNQIKVANGLTSDMIYEGEFLKIRNRPIL